jgi:hypothetical protein
MYFNPIGIAVEVGKVNHNGPQRSGCGADNCYPGGIEGKFLFEQTAQALVGRIATEN